jgi:pimeloyl-ACP methyl ester carboxylesterase
MVLKKRQLIYLFGVLFCGVVSWAQFDARREIIKFMENSGMERYLQAPVAVTATPSGVLSIVDAGIFAIQYELLRPDVSCDPNVTLDAGIAIPSTADKLVIVTHGWLDKGENNWPGKMAEAIAAKTDPNEWVCVCYDWKGGSAVITSVQAAQYARDVAGPRLAAAIDGLGHPFRHIHLVGHSAGSWTVHAAAERLAATRPDTAFHLTFLDAYVPEKWDPDGLGRIFSDADRQKSRCWAEHYYTKDITWKVTQHDLKYAHNVDITDLDPFIKEHEFPYRWYLATITGSYDRWDEKNEPVHTRFGGIDYGFARSRESGNPNWTQTRKLEMHNKAVEITAEKK